MSGDFGFLFKGNSFVHLRLGTKTATHAVSGCQIHHGDPLNRAHCVRFMALPYKDTQQRNTECPPPSTGISVPKRSYSSGRPLGLSFNRSGSIACNSIGSQIRLGNVMGPVPFLLLVVS